MKSPFRSIRQTLFLRRQGYEGHVISGKLLRYLGYAIGEIALIIIGIMLALQLNNWNEDRKAQAEFEAYIVQLREDVRDAIDNVETNTALMETFLEQNEFVLTFLGLSDYTSEELEAFETGLTSLGNYSEAQIYVGLLGDLMNGNMTIIGRDPALARRSREMESHVKTQLKNADHVYNQLDLAADRLNQFRGKGGGGKRPIYNLEKLKSSEEVVYTTSTILGRVTRVFAISGSIKNKLEEFLTVLEEYE